VGETVEIEGGYLVFTVDDIELTVVAFESEGERVAPDDPIVIGCPLKVVLEDTGVGEVIGWADT
jgi:hypothetical protein